MSDIVLLVLKEIPPERVTIMEELGRGAFGKVHKGILKEMPKVEVFFKPKEEREDHIEEGRVVAVKLLHGKFGITAWYIRFFGYASLLKKSRWKG